MIIKNPKKKNNKEDIAKKQRFDKFKEDMETEIQDKRNGENLKTQYSNCAGQRPLLIRAEQALRRVRWEAGEVRCLNGW